MEILYDILLNLDAIIYTFINYLFKAFLLLAQAEIFTEESIAPLIKRIYTLIGVVMLFLLSYSFLRSIVTPENSKDKDSPTKIIFNVIKCIVLLALVPTIFTFAFNVQNAILKHNTIGKIILGTENCVGPDCNNSSTINNGGIEMAVDVYKAFLFPKNEDGKNTKVFDNSITFDEAMDVIRSSGDFFLLDNLSQDVVDGNLVYYWGVSSAAGLFMIYMLLSYCLSLGFRVIKLAFYEIMAPICIIASIIPSQKDMLSKWIKATIQTFIEVFLRVAILYFSVYLIKEVREAFSNGLIKNVSGVGEGLAKCIIIMGIITFMKKAPELISNITGMDKNNMGLGLKEKLAAGGFFTAGAIAGGALIGASRNLVGKTAKGVYNAKKYKKELAAKYKEDEESGEYTPNQLKKLKRKNARRALTYGTKSFFGGLSQGVVSGFFGGLSGGFHGFDGEAKDFKTMGSAAKKGYETAGKNALKRADYKAKHSKGEGFVNDMYGVAVGHIKDFGSSALNMVGVGTIEVLKTENSKMKEITAAKDSLDDGIATLVLKTAKKGKTTIDLSEFGMEEINLQPWIDAKNELEKGKASGADNIIELEKAEKDAMKKINKTIANAMLTKSSTWDNLTDEVKAMFSDVKVQALAYKGAIRNNASIEAVKNAGIYGGMLADNQDFIIDEKIDKMEEQIKIILGKNEVDIMAAEQNKEENKDKS